MILSCAVSCPMGVKVWSMVLTANLWRSRRLMKFKSLPKMLFIQACQGQGHSIEHQVRPDSGPAEERIDLYTCLASVPGDKSYRDINRGSWFVTELCKILCKYATCLSLQSEDFKKHLEDSTYKIYVKEAKKWFVQEPFISHELKKYVHFFL